MGIYDRDYYRKPAGNAMFGSMRVWSVNTWLIAVNVAVFILQSVFGDAFTSLGWFSVDTAIYHLQIWRLITMQFLHAGVPHIAYNMIALFFMGPLVENVLGSRRYLAFYLLCGVTSALSYVLLWRMGMFGDPAEHIIDPLVGASGGIFGVLIAAAMIAPDVTVMLDFFIPMKLRTFAWILLAIAVVTVIRNGENAGGQAAHLGGAAAGFALIKNPQLLNWANYRRGPRMRYRP
jgi:membrane associated rhomboid family serine protease